MEKTILQAIMDCLDFVDALLAPGADPLDPYDFEKGGEN